MSSSINPNNINGNYPIAGQDNDSQGFRDNFTNIKNNLTFAKTELEDLQSKAILTTALVGGTTPTNNMSGAILAAPQIKNSTESVNQLVASAGALTLDYSLGHLHYTTIDSTSGSVSLAFTNWPTATNGYGKIRMYINVTDSTYTLTLPSAVSVGLPDIEGSSGQVITFPSPGKYLFEFSSYDAGTTIIIQDLLRNYETQLGNAVTLISASVTGGTASNSTTNGALIVSGGVGVSGNIYANKLFSSNGSVSTGTFDGTFSDGIIFDYTSGTGRISVGASDGLTIYNGGLANTPILAVNSSKTLTTYGAKVDAGYQYGANVTGFSTTIANTVSRLIIDPAGTLANGTVTLPSANVDATVITISSTQTITAFQVLPNTGTTLVPSANITLTGGTSATYFYHASETKWYKIG